MHVSYFWFNFRNVYHDSYNDSLGQYLYTGEGQKGDQTLSFGNKGLADAKKDGKKIHFFRQYIPRSNHQYTGEVEVSGFEYDTQEDLTGKQRRVIIFHLTPKPNKSISTIIN